MRYLGLVACVLVLLGGAVSSAWAAFPGRDGLLAVQPVSGSGVILVDSHGRQERRICRDQRYCRSARRPRWSADGRVLAVTSPSQSAAPVAGGVSLIYPDGSCLDCQSVGVCLFCSSVGADAPGFLPAAGLLTVVSDGALLEYGVDGLARATVLKRGVSDAVWSSRGALAVVRGGRVSIGQPGRLRSIGAGADPSWSPDGTRLVISRGGWLTVIGQEDHRVRRLVRGGAPAWSPDGRWIAFIGADHRLSVVSLAGDRARRVGDVRGVSVDWQPVPKHAGTGCVVAPGSVVVTESRGTSVTLDTRAGFNGPYQAYMGCLRADRRERLLTTVGPAGEDQDGVSSFVVSGDYAGWVHFFDSHYGGSQDEVHVFDLRAGLESRRLGGETATCSSAGPPSCSSAIDDLVLGANGFSAAHTTLQQEGYQTEKIVASDSRGITTLDAVASQCNSCELTALLTGLNLTGDTLTWSHDGTPESAQLQ